MLTVMDWVPPVLTLPLVGLKENQPEPLPLLALQFRVAVPIFCITTVSADGLLPCEALKVRAEGVTEIRAAAPVPDRGTSSGVV